MRMSDLNLSLTQERALTKLMKTGEWTNAYNLQESRNTLDSLVKRGLIFRKIERGAGFEPTIMIFYKSKYKISE